MKSLTKHIGIVLLLSIAPGGLRALSVTPTYQMFELKAGGKTTGQLTITNTDESDLTVTPSVKDFYSIPANQKFKTQDWLRMNTESFVLKKGDSKQISFSVSAPRKAQGELAGNLHFGTKSPDIGMVSLQLSLAIYVAVQGTEKASFDVPAMSVRISSHTEVGVIINNTGNIHLRPRVLVQVFDEKEALQMNAILNYGQPALPGQPRPYLGTVKDYRLPEGKYLAVISVEDVERRLSFPEKKKKFQVMKDGKVQLK